MSEQNNTKSHVAGHTLISILFFMVALALIAKPAMDFYDAWRDKTATEQTSNRIEAINKAVRNYVTANGRYPYPAPMNAPFDTAEFGKEVNTAGCLTGANRPVVRSSGQGGRPVCAGAVPVRTLGLPDDAIYDGYDHRFVYTVTEAFTAAAPSLTSIMGAIRLVDGNNVNATREEGNIIFAVTSMGDDSVGAYSRNGNLIAACNDVNAASHENCNMDASLVNMANKSNTNTNQKFTQSLRFKSQDICEETGEPPPAKVAFLLDTSGSMNSRAVCPPGYSEPCTRMDAAHWAMRRVVGARQSLALDDDDLSTDFTGFTGMDGRPLINSQTPVLSPSDSIETHLRNMCPKGNTPLDEHMWALAARVGMGESVDRPNVIVIVSDGYNNGEGVNTGDKTTMEIAQEINTEYEGRVVVHIIDLGDNQDLANIPAASNASAPERRRGKYMKTSNPSDIINFVTPLSGGCSSVNYKEPDDTRYCGTGAP